MSGTRLVDQMGKVNVKCRKKVREGGGREGKKDGQEGLRGSVGGRCTYLYGEGVTGDKAGVELMKSPLENLVHQTCRPISLQHSNLENKRSKYHHHHNPFTMMSYHDFMKFKDKKPLL